MMPSPLHTHRHIHIPLLYIDTVDCSGAHPHADEEAAPQPELVFIRRGTFTRRDHHGRVIADVNHALFFDRDRPYQVSHPNPGGDASTVFHLRADVLRDLYRRAYPAAADRPDFAHPRGMTPITPRQHLAHHRLLQAARSAHADPLALEEAAIALFESVLCAAFDAPPADPPPSPDHVDLAAGVKLYLSQVFRRKVSLDDVAAAVHVSPYHLARLFKRVTSRSVHQYLVDLRLHESLEALAATRQPITDIALDLGFHSPSHFATAFRRAFALTPSAFRRSASSRALARSRRILQV